MFIMIIARFFTHTIVITKSGTDLHFATVPTKLTLVYAPLERKEIVQCYAKIAKIIQVFR